MSNYTMNQYTLQSYFKSVCNSFYIAYEQVKRLEKLEEELESTCPDEELKMVKRCLKVYESEEEWQQKYIMQKYSKEELEKRKEELEQAKNEYDEKCKELKRPKDFWAELLWKNIKDIEAILFKIIRNKFSVIVTSKEEIIALMAFFRDNSVGRYRIINKDEQCLKSFPTGKKMYEEFFSAYCLCDNEEMEKVIKKYF